MADKTGRRRLESESDRAPGPDALTEAPLTSRPRLFTISEVNALIPALNVIVGQQLREQSDIEQGLGELIRLSGSTPNSLHVARSDAPEVRKLKHDLIARIARYERGWRKVQAMGAVVKDAQTGLVDFYGRIEGRVVWLCWRYGEDSLGYYHELGDGYAGRRLLSADLRKHLLN